MRALFKTVVLGIQYGLGFRSLAVRTGISLFEAGEILARLRARFCRFEDYAQSVRDHAGLRLEIGTPFGWFMQCPPDTNPRTIRNFPIQSTGSEVLHVACVLAERRGIELVAPVHDAIMAEGPVDQADESWRTRLTSSWAMPLPWCCAGIGCRPIMPIIRPGERYRRSRQAMWSTATRLLTAGAGDGVMGSDALFKDAETDPLWQTAGLLANTPPRPARATLRFRWRGWSGCCRWLSPPPISSWPCCCTANACASGARR